MIDSDTLDSQEKDQVEQELSQTSPSGMNQKKLQLRQNKMARENRRIRNSASFRIGKLFKSRKSPLASSRSPVFRFVFVVQPWDGTSRQVASSN